MNKRHKVNWLFFLNNKGVVGENNQETDAKDFDSIADELLNQVDETTLDSSPKDKQEDVSRETEKTTTAEVEKTEMVKEVEGDKSLTPEERIAKIKEILGDDEKAIDAYIKQKGYHADPAWQKQREIIDKLKKEGSLSAEDKASLDEFNKFRSSPDYIKMTMKSEGYTQEAIDKKLVELGHEVKTKPEDDVQFTIDKLGIKLDNMSEEDRVNIKSNVSDIVKISDIRIDEKLNDFFNKHIKPFSNNFKAIEAEKTSNKLYESMKETVKADGILDFDKDIEPALNKFMDENPNTTLDAIRDHFKDINHSLTVERLKTGKGKQERDEKKSNLRQNIPLSGNRPGALKKSGDFEKDADAFLDTVNV